jgi:excisionase family DNA binding protein
MTVRGAERFQLPQLLTIKDVAGILRVSNRTVERLIVDGALPHVRPRPTQIRVHPEDLRAYLDARRQEAAPAPSSARLRLPQPGGRSPRGSVRPRLLDHLQVPGR